MLQHSHYKQQFHFCTGLLFLTWCNHVLELSSLCSGSLADMDHCPTLSPRRWTWCLGPPLSLRPMECQAWISSWLLSPDGCRRLVGHFHKKVIIWVVHDTLQSCLFHHPLYCVHQDRENLGCWSEAIRRVNIDRSAWQTAAGDRICSLHFVSREKTDNPTHPGYIPMLNIAGEDLIVVASWTEVSQRASHKSLASLSL